MKRRRKRSAAELKRIWANERARKRRLLARGILWEHVGGGCCLVFFSSHVKVTRASMFPCDDTFENLKTGQLAEFSTTLEAHQSIPHELRTLAQVTRRKGVKLLSKGVS